MNNPEPPKLLECPKCGYKWYSNSEQEWVCCPKCLRKFDRGKK